LRIDAELRGVDDVYRVLDQIAPREARNIMRATVGGMATELNKDAKDLAPMDEGDLVTSMKVKRRRIRDGQVRADLVVERRAFYWRFIEYGTTKRSADPFYMFAAERFRSRALRSFLTQFGNKFEAALRRARRRNGG